jgi:hypothetical protein
MTLRVRLGYLVACAAVLPFGCGGTVGAAAPSEGGPGVGVADGAVEAQASGRPDDAGSSDGTVDGARPSCMTPLSVRSPGGTGTVAFMISSDGTTCSVLATPGTDAALEYRPGPSGDFPTGQVWVPSTSPWRIVSADGGVLLPGGFDTINCALPNALPPRYDFTLVDTTGDHVSMSVGCDDLGIKFVVFSVSFVSGGVDAAAG